MNKENLEQVIETSVEVEETKGLNVETETVEQTQVTDPKVEEVDIDKLLQSTSSKAKHELLKEIGLGSVKEIKEAIEKGLGVDDVKTELEELRAEKTFSQASLELLKLGFNPDRLESIKPLLNVEGTVDEKVDRIKKELPELFLNKRTYSKTIPNQEESKVLSGAEKYIQSKKRRL